MHDALLYLVDRLDERSTWVWLVAAVSMLFGINFAPEYTEAIIAAGISFGTIIGGLVKDGRIFKRSKGANQ
jgi:hypothetical protein